MNEASDLIFSIALSVMSDSLFLNFQLKNQYECNIKSEKDIKSHFQWCLANHVGELGHYIF